MSYYTTIKAVNSSGKAIKAEINCGGTFRGFTDANTGELSFELSSNGSYDFSAKAMGSKSYGKINGGKTAVIRVG